MSPAPEGDSLRQDGLSFLVTNVRKVARTGSTTNCDRAKWLVQVLVQGKESGASIICSLLDRGLSHASIKVYSAAISLK